MDDISMFDSSESECSNTYDASSDIEDIPEDNEIVSDIGQHDIYTECTSSQAGLPPTAHHLEILKSRFKLDKFKEPQWKVISTILDYINNKQPSNIIDQCIIAASGFGKSLCYQFVPVYTKSLALVISPLISLMEDQVRLMKATGIPATFLGSGQKDSAGELSRAYNQELNLLYITPELCLRKESSLISDLHKNVPICLVAIDEAHCISSWGHDFRPKYGKLAQLRELLPEVPFIALTATASKIVCHEIIEKLKFKNHVVYTTEINRPNLYFEFYEKSGFPDKDLKKLLQIKSGFSEQNIYTFGCPCIVYCITKAMTEQVSKTLNDLGVKSGFYHSGLNKKNRKQIYEKFIRNEIECIVATVAFGMGIDKPDVRMVIHYGAPREMESYMQEAGRAGRDNQPSRCIVLFSNWDFPLLQYIILKRLDSYPELKKHRQNMLIKVENFLRSQHCRRQQLLKHFNQPHYPSTRCCDNCTKNSSKEYVTPIETEFSVQSNLTIGYKRALNAQSSSIPMEVEEMYVEEYPSYPRKKKKIASNWERIS